MFNQEVRDWIGRLRDFDRCNVGNFLEVSLGFLRSHGDYFQDCGYYVVGSSFTGKTFGLKQSLSL